MISRTHCRCALPGSGVLLSLGAPTLRADRTKLKPGMNSFSPQQDIQLGQETCCGSREAISALR
jgi:hypothetical protein